MKNLIFLLLPFFLFSQESQCGFDLIRNNQVDNFNTENICSTNTLDNGQQINIPIVFHVVFNEPEEFVTFTRITEAINILNDSFNASNSITSNVDSNFSDIIANTNISFYSPPPNGCGEIISVSYHTTTRSVFIPPNENNGHSDDIELKMNGYLDSTKYLNVWICNLPPGLNGYALRPPVWDETRDGVVVDYTRIDTSTLAHEIGHYLNLGHIWGPTTAIQDHNCNDDDGIMDTPKQKGPISICQDNFSQRCNPTQILNVQNFMGYSTCRFMFTEGQKCVMRNAIFEYREGLTIPLSCDDTNEPNNSLSEATILNNLGKCYDYGITQNTDIAYCQENDEDYYIIPVNNSGELTVELTSSELLKVDLIDSSGNVFETGNITQSDNSVVLNWTGFFSTIVCSFVSIRVSSISNITDCSSYTLEINWESNISCSDPPTFNNQQSISTQNISISGDTNICQGEPTTLYASGGSGNYNWFANNIGYGSGVSKTFNNLSQGEIEVVVVDQDITCYTGNTTVYVSNNLDAYAGSNVSIQNGESIQLQGSGGTTYSWSPSSSLNNPNIWNPIATPNQTTTYTLTVSENGCTDTDQVTVIVENTSGGGSSDEPINDNCSDAIMLNSNTTCQYTEHTIDFATPSSYPNASCDVATNPNTNDVYFKFIAQSSTHTINVQPLGNNILDAVLSVYAGSNCSNLIEIGCDDTPQVGSATITRNNFIQGQEYWIRVYDYGSIEPPIGQGGFNICVTHPNSSGSNGIDLISSITNVSNNNPSSGDNITVTYTITNTGSQSYQNNFVGGLYLSTNQNFGSADTFLTGSNEANPSIASGETITITKTFSIPNIGDGQYYIVSNPDMGNNVSEIDEDNNYDFALIQIGEIVEDGPNLDITGMTVTPNSNLAPNQEVEIQIEIDNQGNEDAENFKVLFFLDINGNGDFESNEFIDEFSFGSIDADDDRVRTRTVALPSGITSTGSYDLYAIADSHNEISETDEDDNDKRRTINIGTTTPAGPDLVCNFVKWEIDGTNTQVNPLNLCLDTEYRLYWEITNIGNLDVSGGFQVRHRAYISTDQYFDGTDIIFDSRNANASSHDVGVIIPADDDNNWEGVSPGDYYLLLVADYRFNVDEINEQNNVTAIPIRLNNCNNSAYPDIAVAIDSYTPYSSQLGDDITVNMTFTNIGDAPVSNFRVGLYISDDQVFHGSGSDWEEDHRMGGNGSDIINQTLNPGESISHTMTAYSRNESDSYDITYPGIKYLFVSVDENGDLIELSRINNIDYVPIELSSIDCYYRRDFTTNYVGVYPHDQQSYLLTMEAITEPNCVWDVSSPQSWVFLSTTQFTGTDHINFTLYNNPFPFPRNGQIYVDGELFYEFTQEAKPCALLAEDIKMSISSSMITDISCEELGKIDIVMQNGFPPYTFDWSNNTSNQNLSDISQGGQYTLTVTDLAGCSFQEVFVISDVATLDSTITQNGNELFANQDNALYQWIDCDNGNIPISGETNQLFIAQTNGNYAVEITSGTCIDTSICLSVATLGVESEDYDIRGINIYPNPTRTKLNILFTNTFIGNNIDIHVYDINGRLIQQSHENINVNQITINVEELSSGTYFIKLSSDEYTISKLFIKK